MQRADLLPLFSTCWLVSLSLCFLLCFLRKELLGVTPYDKHTCIFSKTHEVEVCMCFVLCMAAATTLRV